MKIQMRRTAAGPGLSLQAGKIYEVGRHPGLTAEVAQDLLDGGNAAPAPETAAVPVEGETAQAEPEEKKATKKNAKKKGRKRASKKVSGK